MFVMKAVVLTQGAGNGASTGRVVLATWHSRLGANPFTLAVILELLGISLSGLKSCTAKLLEEVPFGYGRPLS